MIILKLTDIFNFIWWNCNWVLEEITKSFIFQYFLKVEVYLEPIQTSKMELFVKIINNLMPLTTSTKSSNSYFWSGSKNATKSSNNSFCEFNIFNLAAIWFNTFFLLFWKFLFLLIFKNISKFYCTRLIFIQTNNYVKNIQKNANFVVDKTKQRCPIISKEIFIILIWRKLNMFNFLILKWNRTKLSFF